MNPTGEQADFGDIDIKAFAESVSASYENSLKNFLQTLPPELINTIAAYLPAVDIASFRRVNRSVNAAVAPAWEQEWRGYMTSLTQTIAQNQTWDCDADGADMLAELVIAFRSSVGQFQGRCLPDTEAQMIATSEEVDQLAEWLLNKLDEGTFDFSGAVPQTLSVKLESLRQ
ncbi:hypothetical protein GCM10022247_49280 [Allokutzneria multivorans]|uniref:F-box domain-containing protein n=1 Tax=Allokutzneria multivorans TaxID=1142134 RepID=A0ABP7T1J2_9PSEU